MPPPLKKHNWLTQELPICTFIKTKARELLKTLKNENNINREPYRVTFDMRELMVDTLELLLH